MFPNTGEITKEVTSDMQAVKDFVGLFTQYKNIIGPKIMEYIGGNVLGKVKNAKSVLEASNEIIRGIPLDVQLGNKKAIETIRVMAKEAEKQQTYRETAKAAAGMKGAASLGALGTIGAGVGAVAGMAYPMHRLGRRMGYGIEEKRAGRRLRPAAMPFGEVAAQLPGVQAMKRLYTTPYKRFGAGPESLQQSTARMKEEIRTPLKIELNPKIKDFFSRAYGKIRSVRFKEAK